MVATAAVAACTYGPPEDRVTVENLALKPDGSRLAVIVKYERYSTATGLAAFPDGGVPRFHAQRADLYVVDLPARTLAFRGELPAPAAHRVAFSPWLAGWNGDTVYFKVRGCAGSQGDECYGPLVRTTLFMLPPRGRIDPVVGDAPELVLTSSIERGSGSLGAGAESYGVSIGTRLGAPRVPLMRFVGDRLEMIPVQGP